MSQEFLHQYLKSRDSAVAHSLLEGPPGRLLDLGSGSGEDLRELRLRGWDAVGLEPGQPVGETRAVRGTADRLPFRDATFDAVTSILVLPHVDSMLPILSETRRVLRRGGQALFVLFTNSPLNLRIAASGYRPVADRRTRTQLYSSRGFSRLVRSTGLKEVAHTRTDYLPWMSALLPEKFRKRLFRILVSVDSSLTRTPLRFLARKLVVKAVRP